jgi:biotin-dependent carboxylase-like uncharacterized protein
MSDGQRRVRILDGGLLATVQDLGRFGRASFGVSPAGAADWYSARAANRLVENSHDDALIEATLSGFEFVPESTIRIALTGADASLAIGSLVAQTWCAYDVRAGERVCVGAARRGLRSYVAFAGGVEVPQLMGSRSTDVVGGFGGKILSGGGEFDLGVTSADAARPCLRYEARAKIDLSAPAVLRVLPGPHADRLGSGALAALCSARYTASNRSSRQALRLEGVPVELTAPTDVISAGVVAGCVQITGEGLPIVLLAEHQTTGGYAQALCVITADVPRAAQIRPGDEVSFRIVGFSQASAALDAAGECLRALRPIPALDDGTLDERLSSGFFEGA